MKNTSKKIIAMTLTGAAIASMGAVVNADNASALYIDGAKIENAKIIVKDNTTFIPLRAVCEALDFQVTWDGQSRKIEIKSLPVYITCSPDRDGYTFSKTAPQLLGNAPMLVDDLTYVPSNFVTEILDGTLTEDENGLHISYGAEEENEQSDEITGEVCELVFENDTLKQIVLGDANDPNTQTIVILTEEAQAKAKELDIQKGSKIIAKTTGIATLSLPPQVNATDIEIVKDEEMSDVVSGTVCELVYEDEKLVQIVLGNADDPHSQTAVNLSEEIAQEAINLDVKVGSSVVFETTGISTFSIPPQVVATSIKTSDTEASKGVEVSGTICELVYDENEKLIQIVTGDKEDPHKQIAFNLTEELAAKAVELNVAEGMTLKAIADEAQTKSIPAQQALISIIEISK